MRETVTGITNGTPKDQEIRRGRQTGCGRQGFNSDTALAAVPGRAVPPGEAIPEALSLKPRYFRHQNINKNDSAKIHS